MFYKVTVHGVAKYFDNIEKITLIQTGCFRKQLKYIFPSLFLAKVSERFTAKL